MLKEIFSVVWERERERETHTHTHTHTHTGRLTEKERQADWHRDENKIWKRGIRMKKDTIMKMLDTWNIKILQQRQRKL